MRKLDMDAFVTGIAGALFAVLVLFALYCGYQTMYDAAYNDGFERGAYVERVCPQNRTFHCPVGDK